MNPRIRRHPVFTVVAVAVLVLTAMGPVSSASAGIGLTPGPNAGIIPPTEYYAGHNYGEWSNIWWNWALTLPVDPADPGSTHPVWDPTGARCDAGQSGPVWFLAGNFTNGNFTRKCEVPADTALFVPLWNAEDDTGWEVGRTPEQVDEWVDWAWHTLVDPASLYFELDGREVTHLVDYAVSPGNPGTEIMLPDYSPLLNGEQLVEGVQAPLGIGGPFYMATVGYSLMLKPLSPGKHTIFFRYGTNTMTYNLIVRPPTADPGVIPPQAKPFGHTYGEWSNKWWQWANSLPVVPGHEEENPLFDTTGVNCGAGQSGKVWFLPGIYTITEAGRPATDGLVRTQCVVPKGTAIFIPVINTEADVAQYPGWTVEQLRASVAESMGYIEDLQASIDGRPISNVRHYVVGAGNAPVGFDFPENNLYQYWGMNVPAGHYEPMVTDGFYMMIAPLSPGEHWIHVYGTAPFYGFTLDVTYGPLTVR